MNKPFFNPITGQMENTDEMPVQQSLDKIYNKSLDPSQPMSGGEIYKPYDPLNDAGYKLFEGMKTDGYLYNPKTMSHNLPAQNLNKPADTKQLAAEYKDLLDKLGVNSLPSIPYDTNNKVKLASPATTIQEKVADVESSRTPSGEVSQPPTDARMREETTNPRDIDFSYEKLQDILKNRDSAGLSNIMLRAGMMANQGISRMGNADVRPDEGALQALSKQADMPLEGFTTKMRAYGEIENQDPKSDISKFARERAKVALLSMDPKAKVEQLDNMSAAQLEKLGLFKRTSSEIDPLRLLQIQNYQDNALYNRSQREEGRKIAADKYTDKKVQELSESINKQAGDVLNAFSGIDAELMNAGMPKLTDLRINKDKILNAQGKEVDLPGTNILGLGRTAIPFTGANKFQSALDALKNITLKDRSGAAVTDSEFNRLQKEFAEKRFTNESDMLNSILRMREALGEDLKRIENAFPAEARNEYRSRPGNVNIDAFQAKQKAADVKQPVRNVDLDAIAKEKAKRAAAAKGQ